MANDRIRSLKARAGSAFHIAAALAVVVYLGSCSGDEEKADAGIGKSVQLVTSPQSVSLQPVSDTFVGSGIANSNQGYEAILRLKSSGKNRALITFDDDAVRSAVGQGTLTSATLLLPIADTSNNWGSSGRTIDLHSLTAAWTEEGATWNCAIDSITSNSTADCAGVNEWEMGNAGPLPWQATPTASTLITSNLTGSVVLDVTADVSAIVAGGSSFGWILKKTDEGAAGRIELASDETGDGPQLVLNFDGDPPPPDPNPPTELGSVLASADTYLKNGQANKNFGAETILSIKSSGKHRSLIRFDQTDIETLLGSSEFAEARLEVTVTLNADNWGDGRAIAIHPLIQDFTELGSTWNCADDSNTSNSGADCSGATEWEMSGGVNPWNAIASDVAVVDNGLTGVLSFDVSNDVAAVLAGGTNTGWMIKKADEGQSGHIEFESREGTAGPRLVIFSGSACVPESDSEFCARVAGCGSVTDDDNCGDSRTVDCGGSGGDDSTCDGLDDDCDSLFDENYSGSTTNCGVGVCGATGNTSCTAGIESDDCTEGSATGSDADCDGVDNDCDGNTDESFASTATSCGLGNCAATGATLCSAGSLGDSCVPGPTTGSDDTCDGDDDDCDGAIDEAFVLTSCASAGANCGSISDGCFSTVDCGSCNAPETCGGTGVPNNCGCTPTSCAAQGATCGSISDGCGGTLDCGSCGGLDTCGGAGVPNTCGCQPTTCQAQGASCGTIANGCGGTLVCGSCSGSDTCGGDGVANNCGCTAITCAEAGVSCGQISDGCGAILSCDSCIAPTLDPVGNQSFDLGTTLNLQLSSTSPNATYYASPLPLPANASLNAITGDFVFHPTDGQVGDLDITFGISDGLLSAEETITISVNGPQVGTQPSLHGRLLDTNDFVSGTVTPIVGATVSLLGTGTSTTSDVNGFFILTSIPAGSQVLDIASATAQPGPGGVTYAGFREAFHIIDGVANIVDRPFYLPRIHAPSLTTVDPALATTVTNGDLEISIVVPPNTAKNPDSSNFTGMLSISEVPEGLAPAAMPSFLQPGLVVTIQPVGVTFATPVPISFRNENDLTPGSELDIWSLDPDSGTFAIVGTGQVSLDGQRIETISGGVRASDWHFILPPAVSSVPEEEQYSCPAQVSMGSSTSVASGDLRVQYDLPSYVSQGVEQGVRLVYTSLRADPRPVVHTSTTILTRAAVPQAVSTALSVGNVGGEPVFWDSAGLSESQDESFVQSVQMGGGAGSPLATGVYDFDLITTAHYSGGLGRPSGISTISGGRMVVNNQERSLVGAGWTVAGVSRLHLQPDVQGDDDPSILIVSGSGESLEFTPDSEAPIVQPGVITIEESGWALSRTVSLNQAQPARVNPVDGLLYAVRRNTASGGLYRFAPDGSPTLVISSYIPSNVLIDPDDGDTFVAEDYWNGGGVIRTPFGTTTREPWVSTFHGAFAYLSGMAMAPSTYTGSVVSPGDILVVDRGGQLSPGGLSEVWRFSPDTAGSDTVVHADDGTLIWPVDIAIGTDEIYLVDHDADAIYRLNPGGVLVPIATSEAIVQPICIAIDPSSQQLLVAERGGQRLLRIDPNTGDVATIMSGFAFNSENWSCLGFSADGGTLVVSDGVRNGLPSDIFTFSYTPPTTEIISPPGDFSKLVQNPDGTWTRSFPSGAAVEYDSEGLQTSVTDANGNATLYAYNGLQNLTAITDPVGQVTSFSYGAGDRLATITDPAGRITTLQHDPNGNLVSAIAPDLSERHFIYDSRHRMTSQISERGLTRSYIYDTFGRHVRSLWPDGSERSLSPTVTAALQDLSTGVGTKANPAPITRKEDIAASFIDGEGRTTEFDIGDLGRAKSVTDTAGFVTTAQRDDDGNVTRLALPSGHAVSSTFDEDGNQVSSLDETTGGTTSSVYEAPYNRLTSVTDDDGTTTLGYDGPNLTSTSSPSGLASAFTYDARGNLLASVNSVGVASVRSYDANDNLLELRVGTAPNERITTFTRTPEGSVATVTDPLGRVTTTNYDALGRAIASTLPDGRVVGYAFDETGNISTVTPPGRPAHAFDYTETNQLSTYTPPVVGPVLPPTAWTYNDAQQLTGVIRPDGRASSVSYDSAGRPQSISMPEETRSLAYRVDTGQLDTISSAAGALSFAYAGELVEAVTWAYGVIAGTVTTRRDTSYRIDELEVAGEAPTVYSYNSDGQLVSAGAISIFRDGLTGLVTATSQGLFTEGYGYSEFAEFDHYESTYNGGQLFDYDLTLDALGRIVGRAESNQGVSADFVFGYDLAGRLVTVTKDATVVEQYGYDSNDNRISATTSSGSISATYDDQDRLLTYGANSYTYTDNGEVATKTTPTGTTSFSFDTNGTLRGMTLEDGTQIEYVIDAYNRRIGKKVDGTLVQGWLYKDSVTPVAELDGAGNVVNLFVYGMYPHAPDYVVRSNGDVHRFVNDRLGSARMVVDVATGAVVAEREFDSFGVILSESNPSLLPFGFAGGIYDAETGLTQFGARDYDSEVGRWTAKDPSLFGGGLNFYLYANADPMNHVDLTGRQATTVDAFCLRRPGECAAIGLGATGAVAGAVIVARDPDIDIDLQDCADALGDATRYFVETVTRALPWTSFKETGPARPERERQTCTRINAPGTGLCIYTCIGIASGISRNKVIAPAVDGTCPGDHSDF